MQVACRADIRSLHERVMTDAAEKDSYETHYAR